MSRVKSGVSELTC